MQSLLLNEKSMVFERADPYAVSEYVNQHVGSHCIRLPATSRPQASLNHTKFASLDLCRISYGASVHVTSPALETIYHLQILLRGQCLSKSYGQEHYFAPGELLAGSPCRAYSQTSQFLPIKSIVPTRSPLLAARP